MEDRELPEIVVININQNTKSGTIFMETKKIA